MGCATPAIGRYRGPLRQAEPMHYDSSLIPEVEAAMSKASVMQRATIARQLTDLFSKDAASYSSEAIQLFDSIFAVVAQNIDQKALMELRERLAATNITLSEFARQLAMIDDIQIAGGPGRTRTCNQTVMSGRL
jgi:hypothetical protein